jgi:long-chain fatty acid transport protein
MSHVLNARPAAARCRTRALGAVGTALLLTPLAALATNGYFPHGYGLKAKGMGGVAVSQNHDSLGGANNPASMAFAGNRLDLGLEWFQPKRSASRSGSMGGAFDFSSESDSNDHFVPEFGYVQQFGSTMAGGVTVYGNGGMNTDYPGAATSCGNPAGNVANGLCGNGRLGVDMMQLIVAPTFALKLAPDHALGVSPLFGYQRFKVTGLQAFDNAPGFPPFTGSPGSVTNNGYDSSTGWGLRLGYQGKVGPVTLGAAYATKMSMSAFDKYKGLFAENGDFDVPSHYALGVAWQAMPALQVAAEWMRINYSDVASVSNPSSNQAPLGAANGPGFGWRDIDVLKLGVQWQAMPGLTLRAGYNKGDNPISSGDVTFNILAPGVITTHYTLGGTMQLGASSELTLAYMRAPEQTVTGPSMFNSPALLGPGNGGTDTIKMRQQSLGVAWAMRF